MHSELVLRREVGRRPLGQSNPFALDEIGAVLRRWDIWATLAWFDTKLRYRRTFFGPFWITLSTGATIFSIGLVYGAIFGVDISSYMPYFAAGLIIWTLVSGALLEGCSVFIQAGGLIKAVPAPLLQHVFRLLSRQFILFVHNVVLIGILWIIFRWSVDWSLLLVIPGIAIVTLTLFGSILILGVLCTRFRDIEKIIGAILQLVFLITPIIWMPHSLRGDRFRILLDFNPFYYLIQVVRGPLLGDAPPLFMWFAAIGCAVACLVVGLAFYARFRHRIAYWL